MASFAPTTCVWRRRLTPQSQKGVAPSRRATQSASVHRRDAHEHRRVDGGEQLVAAEEVAQEAVHHAELAAVLLERRTLGGERGGRELALAPARVGQLGERQLAVEARATQRRPPRVVHQVGEDGPREREDAACLELAQRLGYEVARVGE